MSAASTRVLLAIVLFSVAVVSLTHMPMAGEETGPATGPAFAGKSLFFLSHGDPSVSWLPAVHPSVPACRLMSTWFPVEPLFTVPRIGGLVIACHSA